MKKKSFNNTKCFIVSLSNVFQPFCEQYDNTNTTYTVHCDAKRNMPEDPGHFLVSRRIRVLNWRQLISISPGPV